MNSAIVNIFVYGTLKRGQCRQSCWPATPVRIQRAWTLGQLHDLGPHPAMLQGMDRIAGEVWSFAEQDAAAVRNALDLVEGTNQPGATNEYDRLSIEVHLFDGERLQADAYFFADQEGLLRSAHYIEPALIVNGSRFAIWPRASSWNV